MLDYFVAERGQGVDCGPSQEKKTIVPNKKAFRQKSDQLRADLNRIDAEIKRFNDEIEKAKSLLTKKKSPMGATVSIVVALKKGKKP